MNDSKIILPIWHKVLKDEALNLIPNLADKVALKSSNLSVYEISSIIK